MTQLRCEAHCDVQQNELVLLEMNGKLEKGELDARGGVIAGTVLMMGAQTHGALFSMLLRLTVYGCTVQL